MNQTGPNYMDPRSSAGILSRGQNVYQATSYSPHSGQMGAQQQQQSQAPGPNVQGVAQSLLPKPPNSMMNIDFQRVAKWLQAPTA